MRLSLSIYGTIFVLFLMTIGAVIGTGKVTLFFWCMLALLLVPPLAFDIVDNAGNVVNPKSKITIGAPKEAEKEEETTLEERKEPVKEPEPLYESVIDYEEQDALAMLYGKGDIPPHNERGD